MPIVQVSVWEGITSENKKKIVEGITKVFEDMGVPKQAVHIAIYEALKATGQQAENYIQKNNPKHPLHNLHQSDASN